MADEKHPSTGKIAQSAEKSESVAKGMSHAAEKGTAGSSGGTSKSGPGTHGASSAASNAAGSSMSKGSQAAEKGEATARGMNRAATSATSTMADAGAKATRDMGQAARDVAGAGASAARTMGQAAAGAMGSGGVADFSKMFEGLRMPAMPDMDLMLGAYRRNMEALSAANRVALEGAQQIARRNMEIIQQTMGEMTDAMRSLSGAESPQDRAGKQAEMLKGAYERAVQHMKELADLIQRSNGEALEVLNQRFTEAMDEARTIVEKTRA